MRIYRLIITHIHKIGSQHTCDTTLWSYMYICLRAGLCMICLTVKWVRILIISRHAQKWSSLIHNQTLTIKPKWRAKDCLSKAYFFSGRRFLYQMFNHMAWTRCDIQQFFIFVWSFQDSSFAFWYPLQFFIFFLSIAIISEQLSNILA